MFKISFIASACLCALSLHSAYAQTSPNAADVLRNIEQNKLDINRTPKPAAKKPVAPATTDQGFARLKEIQVNSPMFQNDLMAYWVSEINKPVPAQKLADFKAFAWELFQNKGYLAYITTSAQPTPEGSVLTVNVSMPTVGKVTVVTLDGNKGKEYADEVARRFSDIYKLGATVDVQGFESQLNAIAYDLPVDLEVSMRQVNATVVDVVINLRPVNHQLGSVLGGMVQANNFGLSQFGRNQVLGSVRVSGLTPLSELSLVTQQSSSVKYYRADYEAPVVGSGMRVKGFVSQVNSETNITKGLSKELGGGLTKLLITDRNGRWATGVDVSRRESQNWASGVQNSDRVDQQVRLKLRAESSKTWIDNFSNELVLTAGRINLDRNAADKVNDAAIGSGAHVAGIYQKLEMNGGLSQGLDRAGAFTGSVRWKVQTSSKNLDTYNKISLGGVNGVRAYSSLDGVGDQGAQVSLDVIHQVVPDVYGGLFYDAGTVKNSRNPLSSSTDTGYYNLQAAGMQVGGKVKEFNWVMTFAYGMGRPPASLWNATNTQPGDSRINFSVTRPL